MKVKIIGDIRAVWYCRVCGSTSRVAYDLLTTLLIDKKLKTPKCISCDETKDFDLVELYGYGATEQDLS